MKNRKLQASYTVEASLLMPIILFIIIALMYMTFYLHDISRIRGVLDKSAMKSGMIIRHKGSFITGEPDYGDINNRGVLFTVSNLEEEISITSSYVKQRLSKGLIIAQINNIEVEANHNEISIKVLVKMNIPFWQVKKYITGSGYEFSMEAKSLVHNPAEFIRCFDSLANTVTKVNGSEEVINNLKKAIERFQ